MPRLYATIVLPSGFTIEKESYLRLFNPNASFEKGNLVPDQIDAVNANITVSLMGYPNWATNFTWSSTNVSEICIQGQSWTCISYNSFEVWTRVRDNILKSKEQKNIQPTKGGHKMVTCQNYVSLFYRQITSCPSDGGIS